MEEKVKPLKKKKERKKEREEGMYIHGFEVDSSINLPPPKSWLTFLLPCVKVVSEISVLMRIFCCTKKYNDTKKKKKELN